MRSLLSLLPLSLLLVACGGSVVVDTDGSSPITEQPSCADACNATAAACPGMASDTCTASCEQSGALFAEKCPEAWSASLACITENPASQCMGISACDSELAALTTCVSMVCTDPDNCF
ncbi:Hypothetical protein A7982_09312 [Minicystis rosea]|nr:Hypothetical protein A7982_09312 [Minicystis rosea]